MHSNSLLDKGCLIKELVVYRVNCTIHHNDQVCWKVLNTKQHQAPKMSSWLEYHIWSTLLVRGKVNESWHKKKIILKKEVWCLHYPYWARIYPSLQFFPCKFSFSDNFGPKVTSYKNWMWSRSHKHLLVVNKCMRNINIPTLLFGFW